MIPSQTSNQAVIIKLEYDSKSKKPPTRLWALHLALMNLEVGRESQESHMEDTNVV